MGLEATESVPECILCRVPGVTLHENIHDFLFENKGVFSFRRCPECGLVWLSPRPVPKAMGKFYRNYYTHSVPDRVYTAAERAGVFRRLRDRIRDSILCGYYGYRHIHTGHLLCRLGGWLGKVPFLRERAANELRALLPFYKKGGRIVDVGCGSGSFLVKMQILGWEVFGLETDPRAVEVAANRGIQVKTSTLEESGLPENWADAVTMNHVIEHVYDPVTLLCECKRILKKGGRLAFYTPNALSLGHNIFKRAWRGLEPPRHLYIFSPMALQIALNAAGFSNVTVKTSARNAGGIYAASAAIRLEGNLKGREVKRSIVASTFAFWEMFLCALGAKIGEELEVIAVKPGVL